MNSYQMVFLIFVFLPPVLSIVVYNLTNRIDKLNWIDWSDIVVIIYILESVVFVLVSIYNILGAGL